MIFAGWKNNGGGYQVWIAHGSDLYTTYNHMSAITVGVGQHVGRGQQVGRIGQTGNATGPHLHFEVWSGPVWDGGHARQPAGATSSRRVAAAAARRRSRRRSRPPVREWRRCSSTA